MIDSSSVRIIRTVQGLASVDKTGALAVFRASSSTTPRCARPRVLAVR